MTPDDAASRDGGAEDQLLAELTDAPDAGARTDILLRRLSGEGGGPLTAPGAQLAGVALPRARLRRARLPGADLREADLGGAFLAQSDLTEAHLEGAALRRVDLSHAVCAGARFGEADLREALFEEADLRGAKLRFADLRGAAFEAADLTDADLWGARMDGADFAGAVLNGAAAPEAKAPGADFSRAELRRTNLTDADLTGARLAGVDLRETQLGGARLDGADLTGASLQDVDLSRCGLEGCCWNLARLDRTTFDVRQLGGAVGEERERRWDAAAGAYLALERNFSELGAVDAASWAYGRRRRMQKRTAGRTAALAWRERRWGEALRATLTYAGDTLVEWSCGYGESVGRVFASLVLSFFVFMAVYAVEGAVTRTVGSAHVVSRRVMDLAMFSMEAMTNTQAGSDTIKPSDTTAVFLAGAQTLVSIFLTGLLGFVAGNRIRR